MTDDIISRTAVLECFHDWVDQRGDVHTADEMVEYQAIEALPSAQQWIPCSERLPEDGRVVLWCNEHGSVFTTAITARFDNSWAVGKRHRSSRMVAWMPLPAPWEGEQNG